MESAAANEDVEIEEQLKQILAEGSKSFNMATMFLPSTIRHSARPPIRPRRVHAPITFVHANQDSQPLAPRTADNQKPIAHYLSGP